MSLVQSLPEDATLTDLRNAYVDLFEPLRPYAHRLMRGPSPLTPGERELIAAYVSGLNGCRFCHGTHALVARRFGVDASVMRSLLEDVDVAPIDAKLRPLLRYVRKLTESPTKMTKGDADAVREAGWSDEALVHAVAVCAYFNQMNRLVEGAGIVGTSSAYENGAERLFLEGYRR